jgi:hypothetical protein
MSGGIPLLPLYAFMARAGAAVPFLLLKEQMQIYRTIILPVVLYGCETWSLTLREELRLMVFENRVLRKIFGPKIEEVTGEWRGLHNEEFHDLHSSPNIIRVIRSRRMRWAGHGARIWRQERCIQDFGEETAGKEIIWKT